MFVCSSGSKFIGKTEVFWPLSEKKQLIQKIETANNKIKELEDA